jgi:ubiquinone biosynthesis protein UbiJ
MRTLTHYLPNIVNRYLALDPESWNRLHALQNKVVTIELLTPPSKNEFQLTFTTSGIALKTSDFSKPDTVIKGTPLSLFYMALSRENRKKFFEKDISIEGDLELGQKVIDLFDRLEIDWEEHVSHYLGDVPAHQLGRFTRKLHAISRRLKESLTQNMNEYVHEEIKLFPPPEELQDFYDDIDTLRMDTDRLEVKIQQLTQKIASKRDLS